MPTVRPEAAGAVALQAFDPAAPIIIVGPGRSGTTRLCGTLGEHPDVYMINETSFLLPRLWATFNERPDYVRIVRLSQLARQRRPQWHAMPWGKFWQDELGADLAAIGPLCDEIESEETARLQRAFGAFFAETLIPPSLRKPRWGFTEVWAGGDAFPYDWQLHLAAFPSAHFVQSLRHPVGYARSMFSNAGHPNPTDDQIAYALSQWVAMVRHARSLRATGRYLEFRMEDFDIELPRILSALDLDPALACVDAAGFRYLPSPHHRIPITATTIDRVVGLRELAEELGYPLDGD